MPISLRWIDVINIIAVALSPLIAVLVSMWVQARKEKRQHKVWLFSKLMETRHSPITDETVRALNLIDVVFADKPNVRRLWHEYFDMLNNQGLNNPQGWKQRQTKNLELITEMANVCGYGHEIKHIDVDRVYYPKALEQSAKDQRDMTAAMLKFLKGVAAYLKNHEPDGSDDLS